MPELPEVETVRNTLLNLILNEEISDVKIFYSNIIKEMSTSRFKDIIIGQKITDIRRKGKFLIFILENQAIVSHLRMEGKYFIKDVREPYEKHEHIIFEFASEKTLRYHDTRKFGTMHLKELDDIYTTNPINKLGLEIFDSNMSISYLRSKINNSRRSIKAILLDQSIVSGFGNIYVDEVCFLSGIHPTEEAIKLNDEDLGKIINSGKIVLNKAIKLGGTTIRSYTSSLGVTGRFQNELKVHNRSGENCYICGTKIAKIRVAGRGTYFCCECQKLKDINN